MNIEKVTWVDSHSSEGTPWTLKEEIGGKFLKETKITTVGFVYKETKKVLCMASSVASIQVAGVMVIPKRSIVSRETLVECGE